MMEMTGQIDILLLEALALSRLGDAVVWMFSNSMFYLKSYDRPQSACVRGFTAGAASLISFCLFVVFTRLAGVTSIDLMVNTQVLPGKYCDDLEY